MGRRGSVGWRGPQRGEPATAVTAPGREPATAVTAPGRYPATAVTAPGRSAERPAYAAAPLGKRGRSARAGSGARGPEPALHFAGAAPTLLPGGVKAPLALPPLPNCRPRCDCAGRRSQPFAPILPTGQSGATPAICSRNRSFCGMVPGKRHIMGHLPLPRRSCWAGLLALGLMAPIWVGAQQASGNWANVTGLARGQRVEVVLTSLETVRGTVQSASTDQLTISASGETRALARGSVVRVAVQRGWRRIFQRHVARSLPRASGGADAASLRPVRLVRCIAALLAGFATEGIAFQPLEAAAQQTCGADAWGGGFRLPARPATCKHFGAPSEGANENVVSREGIEPST